MKTLFLAAVLACSLRAQEPFQVKVTGHGRPMILIPGLASSGETWDSTAARYKDRFECHVLTVAGFAGVPRVPAPMLDKVRDGLAVYVRTHHLEKPVIVGHSLGGFIGMDFAAKYPDVPGKLAIVDIYPFAMGLDPAMTPAKAMYEMYGADLREEVAKITVPTLVFGTWRGNEGYGASHETADANLHSQYAKVKGVEIHVTDTARHFIMWDDPDWVFSHMDRFLKAER